MTTPAEPTMKNVAFTPFCRQNVQDLRRVDRIGPVVERQGDDLVVARAPAGHSHRFRERGDLLIGDQVVRRVESQRAAAALVVAADVQHLALPL